MSSIMQLFPILEILEDTYLFNQVSNSRYVTSESLSALIRASLILLALLIGSLSTNLEIFFIINGCFFANFLQFVFPPLLYLKCFEGKLGILKTASCYIVVTLGFLNAAFGL